MYPSVCPPPGLLYTSHLPLLLLFPSCSIPVNRINPCLHLSSHLSSLPHAAFASIPPPPFPRLAPATAVVSADVRCGACGGGGGEGVEPQSGDRSEAAQLHLAADLATRDQPDELPAHGKHLMNATAQICASCLLRVSVMKHPSLPRLMLFTFSFLLAPGYFAALVINDYIDC